LVATSTSGAATSQVATLTVTIPPFLTGIESFETGYEGWTVEGTQWEVGLPTYGPPTNSLGQRAHSGSNCAATVLGGDYADDTSGRLASPAFVVPAADQNPRLRFWQWYSFGGSGDHGEVQIKMGTNDWQTLAQYTASGSGVWSEPGFDLSAYAGQTVQVGFYFESHGFNWWDGHHTDVGPGWYIDEVTLMSDLVVLIDAGVVRTQEVSCLPLTISPGKPAINVSFTLQALSGDLTNVTLDTGNRFTSATVTPLSNFEWLIALQTSPTNPLLGGETVGSVCFNAVSEHSTFGRLVVKDVAATNLDGSLPTTVGSGSGVVIIANEPLLKISLGSSGEWQLALYGKASVQYEIQYTTDLDLPWLTGWTNTMPASMSCSQAVPPTYPQTPALFFRARECVAP